MGMHPPRTEAELQLALRALRRDFTPTRDLWPQVAARLQEPGDLRPAPILRSAHPGAFALAACLLLALGMAAWLRPADWPGAGYPLAASAQSAALAPEVAQLTRHYQAALRELDTGRVPASWQPGLRALDQSAEQLRQALRVQPDSPLLLDRLRQVYTRRIALARRALYT